MRGKHVVIAIVVATLAGGALFWRNRMAQERVAAQQLAADKAQQEAPAQPPDLARTPAPAAKTAAPPPAAVTPSSTAGDPLWTGDPLSISSRVITFPRKKTMVLDVDLDGDGNPEQLVGKQTHPPGGQGGAVSATGSVQVGDGKPLRVWDGYLTGFWRRPLKLGGGAHVAFYQHAGPDGTGPTAAWVARVDGVDKQALMARTPVQLIDAEGTGVELLMTLSNEMYQDFFATGTMDVMRWTGAAFVSVLPEPAFELCALNPGLGRPIALVMVTRAPPHRLKLIGWNPTTKKYTARQQFAVGAPDDGTDYTVERGFALMCAVGDGTEQRVQYKRRKWEFRDARLFALPSAAQAATQ